MAVSHQPAQIARANGINICYEIFGDVHFDPILLIMGLGCQMVLWDDAFCEQIATRGFRVIRFDNRDTGKSSSCHHGGQLTWSELLRMRFFRIPPEAPYRLRDMAEDAIALMDVLEIGSVHVVGASMGGMIAQEMAIAFPRRVSSLVSIMSTTGNPELPPPSSAAASMLTEPVPRNREEYVARFERNSRVLRAGRFLKDEALDRYRAERAFDRGLNRAGAARQMRAVLASGSRKERLRYVKAPTLVIHGTADPMVHPKSGKDTAASIPGARLMLVPGMGHAIPLPFWPEIIDAIDDHARGATMAPQ